MNRHTFVVQVYPDGASVLENLGTRERVRIPDVGAVGPQINRWLADLRDPRSRGAARPNREDGSGEDSPAS